jgi:hypothetical protein
MIQSSSCRFAASSELVKELASGWIDAVRPSRQPPPVLAWGRLCPEEPPQAASRRGGFLRMRTFLNALKDIPHAEERLKGASRSTHDVDAALRTIPSHALSRG